MRGLSYGHLRVNAIETNWKWKKFGRVRQGTEKQYIRPSVQLLRYYPTHVRLHRLASYLTVSVVHSFLLFLHSFFTRYDKWLSIKNSWPGTFVAENNKRACRSLFLRVFSRTPLLIARVFPSRCCVRVCVYMLRTLHLRLLPRAIFKTNARSDPNTHTERKSTSIIYTAMDRPIRAHEIRGNRGAVLSCRAPRTLPDPKFRNPFFDINHLRGKFFRYTSENNELESVTASHTQRARALSPPFWLECGDWAASVIFRPVRVRIYFFFFRKTGRKRTFLWFLFSPYARWMDETACEHLKNERLYENDVDGKFDGSRQLQRDMYVYNIYIYIHALLCAIKLDASSWHLPRIPINRWSRYRARGVILLLLLRTYGAVTGAVYIYSGARDEDLKNGLFKCVFFFRHSLSLRPIHRFLARSFFKSPSHFACLSPRLPWTKPIVTVRAMAKDCIYGGRAINKHATYINI